MAKGKTIKSKKGMSDFKKKQIKKYTGGKIIKFKGLDDSFVTTDGKTYIGSGDRGWWYIKNNLFVCNSHAHGVAIVLKKPAKEISDLSNISDKDIKGYCGYTHRGAMVFCVGDRFFNEKYKPKKEDYTAKEWNKFNKDWEAYIKKEMKEMGYTRKEAEKYCPISDVIPFRMRGKKKIINLKEAKKAAINMSNYLS